MIKCALSRVRDSAAYHIDIFEQFPASLGQVCPELWTGREHAANEVLELDGESLVFLFWENLLGDSI